METQLGRSGGKHTRAGKLGVNREIMRQRFGHRRKDMKGRGNECVSSSAKCSRSSLWSSAALWFRVQGFDKLLFGGKERSFLKSH